MQLKSPYLQLHTQRWRIETYHTAVCDRCLYLDQTFKAEIN